MVLHFNISSNAVLQMFFFNYLGYDDADYVIQYNYETADIHCV